MMIAAERALVYLFSFLIALLILFDRGLDLVDALIRHAFDINHLFHHRTVNRLLSCSPYFG